MTTRACPKCGEERALNLYQIQRGRASGWCRSCRTECEKERRAKIGVPVRKRSYLAANGKLCVRCDQVRDKAEFSPSSRGLGGLQSCCKSCFTAHFRADKVTARKVTSEYRARHRERHLASHRVRMFEYKTQKKVTDDGTVTDKVLKTLYGAVSCFYCNEPTPRNQRTIDHKMPLSKGGLHSAVNLVMACWGCNCSKRDMTSEEFMEKLSDNHNRKNNLEIQTCSEAR